MIALKTLLVITLCFGLTAPHAVFARTAAVPLGDGAISASPVVGSVWACQRTFEKRPGAQVPFGPWIEGDVWYPSEKPALGGTVLWRGGGLDVSTLGAVRTLAGNGLPDHGTGNFPIQRSDPLYQYDRNPNEISGRRVSFDLPAAPMVASFPTCLPMGPIGFALSGAAIFNALDAVGLDAAAHEIQDACNGHPAGRGNYHYHSGSGCLTEGDTLSDGHSGLVGYAMDGFGIYGTKGEGGTPLTNAGLDACHGHTGRVVWDGKAVEIYHYHLTAEYPYTLGCFAGTPVRAR